MKLRPSLVSLTFVVATASVGCGSDAPPPLTPGGVDAAVTPTSSPDALTPSTLDDAGSAHDGATAADAATPQDPPRGLVVIHSDYRSAAVSLLDRAGNVVIDNCIDSGSVKPKLSLAISGDVGGASAQLPRHEIVLIDRANDALTFLDPSSCAVLRQFSVATGFHSNPYDVAFVTGRLYVPRYERNAKSTPDPTDFDEGNDVLIVDDASGKPVGRIDLSSYAVAAANGTPTLPRAARVVSLADRLYVSLNSIAGDLMTYGTGRVVVIDPTSNAVTGTIDLPTLKNCGALLVAGPSALVVSCGGAFSDVGKQADTAGVAWVDVSTQPPTVTVYPSALTGGRTINGSAIAASSPDAVFVVTFGDGPGTDAVPDQLWRLHSGGVPATKIYDGKGSFVLGDLALDAAGQRLFLTDASKTQRGVQIFDVSNPAEVKRIGQAPSSLAHGLPPRSANWY